jgi:hypothetical protein
MKNEKWDLIKIKESKFGTLYSGPDGETFFEVKKTESDQDPVNHPKRYSSKNSTLTNS